MQNYSSELKVFLRKVAKFVSPLILLLLALELIGYRSGELIPVREVAKLQAASGEELLYERGLVTQGQAEFKLIQLSVRRPEVVMLGSSRVLEFRKEVLPEMNSFYNAGGLTRSVEEVASFFDTVPAGYSPKILFVGIDSFWFDDKNSPSHSNAPGAFSDDEVSSPEAHWYVMRSIGKMAFTNPRQLWQIVVGRDALTGLRAIGVSALSGSGFRNDGSFQRGKEIIYRRQFPSYGDTEVPPIMERVLMGLGQFPHGGRALPERLTEMERFLASARARGVYVIGFLPPYSHEVYRELASSPNFKNSFPVTRAALVRIFRESNYPLYDFSDLDTLNMSDDFLFDGLHITETGAARLMLDMLTKEADKIGISEAALNKLKSISESPETTPTELDLR
ncbi:MAG TPA: hypothetical protein VJB98_03655 [Candidatus Paceibacterota bacterium]